MYLANIYRINDVILLSLIKVCRCEYCPVYKRPSAATRRMQVYLVLLGQLQLPPSPKMDTAGGLFCCKNKLFHLNYNVNENIIT
jgi:hypothetical protein